MNILLELFLGGKTVKDVIDEFIKFLEKIEEEYGDVKLIDLIKHEDQPEE